MTVVELRDRAREQAEGFARAVAGLDQQVVLDEIEARREGARVVAIRDDPGWDDFGAICC